MKFKMTFILVAIALVTFGLYGTGFAFHDGGVARCEGCHTMHNSLNGAAMRANSGSVAMNQFEAGPYLLQGPDSSSACLNCHGSGSNTSGYHVSTEGVTAGGAQLPNQFTPGGDFSWIKYTVNSVGSSRGHNIVAPGWGYSQDSRLITSPGGSYPANVLACAGCHDPHGKTRRLTDGSYVTPSIGSAVLPIGDSGSYGAAPTATYAVGAYRLLGGTGYTPVSSGGAVTFANNPPIAVSPNPYNRLESTSDTRVVYGTGMSEWCANCHSSIHLTTAYSSGTTGLRHPAGNNANLTQAVVDNYNAYVSSGNLTGSATTSYSSLVPYEEQSTDVADMLTRAKTDGTALSGPSTTSTVNCISCHRAHATGFASMVRFDMADALITDTAGVFEPRNGMTPAALTAAYYGRTDANGDPLARKFGVAQRVMCNKCHARD